MKVLHSYKLQFIKFVLEQVTAEPKKRRTLKLTQLGFNVSKMKIV